MYVGSDCQVAVLHSVDCRAGFVTGVTGNSTGGGVIM